ncbi:AAA family ATPase [Streptomyces sp. NPDC059631]|uniref:AAA family ATPase n=1 Tax=unclassified Streptomyces TaxID=2593676 RepID=UPI00368C6E39
MHESVHQAPAYGAGRPIGPPPRDPALIVMIGAAGSGKSTWAKTWPSTQVLELDRFRELVSDEAGDQGATGDAVAALHTVLEARLARKRTTVLDATHTEFTVRARLVQTAHRHGVPAVAFVVPTPEDVCVQRQAGRSPDRAVPEDVVRRQHAEVTAALPQLYDEGFDDVVYASGSRGLEALLRQASDRRRETDRASSDFGETLIRQVFGAEVLPLWRWRPDLTFGGRGRVAEIRLGLDRMVLALHTGVFDLLVPCPYDVSCTAPAWLPVHSVTDLLVAYTAAGPDPETCCTVHGGPYDIDQADAHEGRAALPRPTPALRTRDH